MGNSFHACKKVKIIKVEIAGFKLGTIILKKVVKMPAPSKKAASSSSIFPKPPGPGGPKKKS